MMTDPVSDYLTQVGIERAIPNTRTQSSEPGEHTGVLGLLQNPLDRGDQLIEFRALGRELFSAGTSDCVEARRAVVL